MKTKSVVKDFPVVCVGGSAGGLDAYTRLLRHLPVDMGAINTFWPLPSNVTAFKRLSLIL
jgi:chemotaxis response regulator CheB